MARKQIGQKFVVTAIESISKTLDGISSGKETSCTLNWNENVLEHFITKEKQNTPLRFVMAENPENGWQETLQKRFKINRENA